MMTDPPAPSEQPPPDKLTIRGLMLLMLGTVVGLTLFAPRGTQASMGDPDYWLALTSAGLLGLSLPAPMLCFRAVRGSHHLGAGTLFALASGLGIWLLLPAAVAEWLARVASPPNDRNLSAGCLYYVISSMGLWCLLAAILAGNARRLFHHETPWTERYGLILAMLWSPLGAWQLIGIYSDVF